MTKAWSADPGFWDAVEPVLFDAERWHDAEELAPVYARLLGLEPPTRILDVSCGPGRFTIPLIGMGFSVTVWDPHPPYLDRIAAIVRADPAASRRLTVASDAVGSPAGGALWLDTSYGYEGQAADLRRLSWIRERLRPGGQLLVEGLSRESLEASAWNEPEWQEEPYEAEIEDVNAMRTGQAETQAVWRLQRRLSWARPAQGDEDAATVWLDTEWTRFRHGRATPFPYRHRLYQVDEFSELLRAAGFDNVLTGNDVWGLAEEEREGSDELRHDRMSFATRTSSVWLATRP